MSEQTVHQQGIGVPFEYQTENMVISVNVSDLDRAIAWYGEMLGFPLDYKLDEYGWAEVKTPFGLSIGLGQVESPKVEGPTPTFGVRDIAAARAHLESRGVRFDCDTYEVAGMVKLCTFYDPDGNSWMLAEVLAQSGDGGR